MTDRLAALTGRLDRLSRALAPSPSTAAELADTAGRPLAADALDVARQVFGSDLRPFRSEPFDADARPTESIAGNRVQLTIELRPARAWQYGQKGAKQHVIGDQGRYLRAAGQHPYRGPVRHPGTRGQRAITRARERIRDNARAAVAAGIHNVIEATGG